MRRQLPHEVPSWVPDRAVYFLTICAKDRGGTVLQERADAIIDAARAYHDRRRWHLHLFLVMPDHVHLLATFPPEDVMGRIVAAWKSFVAKRAGFRWQRDFFEHRLRAEESFDEKAHYIRMNPVRAGLCRRPAEWPYCWPRCADGD